MVVETNRSPQSTIRRGPMPEFTWAGVLVGWLLGTVITISISYASLILGFSIEGSELAAILGWGILRGLLRRRSIVENNINQTIASAVNGASAGMMFSIPALFILSDKLHQPALVQFPAFSMVLVCITGGIVGLAFIIPLRKQMIDFDRLAYPGGIAVAAILKSPGAGMRKALLLLAGALFSGTTYLLVVRYWGEHPEWHAGQQFDLPSYLNITFFLSVMTVGVGYLSGKGGFWFGAGGFCCYWVLAPLLGQWGDESVRSLVLDPSNSTADRLRVQLFRPVGIGMLIGAAIGGVIVAFPLIRSAFASLHQASRQRGLGSDTDEIPISWLYSAIGLGAVVIGASVYLSLGDVPLYLAAFMTLLGLLWTWVAGVIIAECVGRTNWSPLSGMTLIGVTILILVARHGLNETSTIIASVMLGAAICVAIAQASDMMLDLKSGYLIGAVPRRQQIAQVLGSWCGPILVLFLIYALHQRYTLGSEKLPAPQGQALASMIEGILFQENVPSYRYAAGAGMGAMLALSGLGGIGVLIGLGFYMPFSTVLTYTLGCLARLATDKCFGRSWADDYGIPLAAGCIVGEALVGVGYALVQVAGTML
ncbi:MAG: oligopeptide transporter, OPT family [Pirellulaceae bacterium]|nr:MAG: oligopeptide transporter, OPT family [Pirellulaceae bacterium]